MIPTIVFGGGLTGLAIARNLGGQGVEVNCVVDGIEAVVFSRFCKKKFFIPNFRERSSLVKRFLQEFSENASSKAVIFAADDVGTLLLSGLRSETKDYCYFTMPSLEIAEKLIVKRKFYKSLIENKIPHPRVILPSRADDLEKVNTELKYPILVKPSISPNFHKTFHKKAFVANSPYELAKQYNLASKHNIDVIFQEIIPGSDRNTFGIAGYFNKESKPLALFAYHRLRAWPNMFGTSSMIESIPVSKYPQLKEIVTRYLERISYSGIMEAEFKLDPRDNEFKLIEINARSWWQSSLPTKCGLNIILKAYFDEVGEKMEYSEEYIAGLKWIDFLNDIRSSITSKEIAKINWIKSYGYVRDWAMFDAYDPLPSMVNLLRDARKLLPN